MIIKILGILVVIGILILFLIVIALVTKYLDK